MAQKNFKQNFSRDFKGIDGLMSALEDDDGAVNRAVNYEFAVSNSLRGSVGCQTQGGAGFFGISAYNYSRTQSQYDLVYQTPSGTYPTQTGSLTTAVTAADGSTINKVIAINEQLWVQDTMNITVTYVSGTYPFTWYTYVSGSNINFNIKANGSSILDTSLGDGISSRTTIYSLLGTIDALAQLSVSRTTRGTCPPYAIVDGNQDAASVGTVTYAPTYSVTVTAHNFQQGDIICFPNCVVQQGGATLSTMHAGIVVSTTATVITYAGDGVLGLTNGQILGYMGQPAAAFPITTAATAASGNLTLAFKYWRNIPSGDPVFRGPFALGASLAALKTSNLSVYQPPSFKNAQANLFIAISTKEPALSTITAFKAVNKTDGTTIKRAGVQASSISASATAAGALTGTYKYKCQVRYVDAQGNITEGRLGTITGASSIATVTYAAQYGTIAAAGFDPDVGATSYASSGRSGFMVRSCFKHTTEAPASGEFFYVDDSVGGVGNPAFIQPGDPVCLLDNTNPKASGGSTGLWRVGGFGATALGALHRTVCIDYCANLATISPTTTSIRVADSSGYTITTNSEISAGLTMVFYRTLAGGNVYYELCEIPMTGYNGGYGSGYVSFLDNVTDATLSTSATLTEPEIGKEPDPPPVGSILCEHQGGLVVSRDINAPNSVSFSRPGEVEAFPRASNTFDVPSTESGAITAIGSDTNDRLAVFKEKAYYDVVGDLDGGNFSINVRSEGDYGITSHSSLIRVRDILVGLSKIGFIRVADGLIDPFFYKEINARIVNQNYNFAWAVGCNDSNLRRYICSIPTSTSGSPQTFSLDYSRETVHTFEISMASNCDMAAGMATVANDFYHLSELSKNVFRRLERFNGNSPTGNNGDSFIHNTSAITYILESNVINLGEPDVLNTPIRLRTWSIPNDYVVDGWVPFSALVETGASPIASYIGITPGRSTSSTITFSATTDVFKDVKLVGPKTHFYIVRFTTNTIRTAPFITGYEILYAENYNAEDLIK